MATCSLPDAPCSGGRPPCPRPGAGEMALPSLWPATIPAYKGGEMDKDPAELWVQMALVPRTLAQPNPGSPPHPHSHPLWRCDTWGQVTLWGAVPGAVGCGAASPAPPPRCHEPPV